MFITQESLDALKIVIEQLSQFYKTSAKVKTAQEEWTRIECMIQSEFEQIIQERRMLRKR